MNAAEMPVLVVRAIIIIIFPFMRTFQNAFISCFACVRSNIMAEKKPKTCAQRDRSDKTNWCKFCRAKKAANR